MFAARYMRFDSAAVCIESAQRLMNSIMVDKDESLPACQHTSHATLTNETRHKVIGRGATARA